MNGVININKPLGYTSNDVVCVMRKILGTKKVGHTGTLDPYADGVLPLCIGRATKISDMLTAQNKQYLAEVTLGFETDTLDSTGTVTRRAEVNVSEEDILQVLSGFLGEIEQIPPMYSAIKIDGKKLYELAREGKTVERKPRTVRIENIEITEFELANNKFRMRVDCSKGTYIRTLCEDMGRRLGCLANMSALTRTRSGRFGIDKSYTIKDVRKMMETGDMGFLISIDDVLAEYPRLVVSQKKSDRIRCGQKVTAQGAEEGCVYRVYDEAGVFLTVSKMCGGELKILKTFYQIAASGGDKDEGV